MNTRSKDCLNGVLNLVGMRTLRQSSFAWEEHKAQIAGTSIQHAATGSLQPPHPSFYRVIYRIENVIAFCHEG